MEVTFMTRASSIKNYLREVAAIYSRLPRMDGYTWCM